MIISFIGSPSSGKTSNASLLFSELKQTGIPAEFLSEFARIYISKKRIETKSKSIILTDQDQLNILREQMDLEDVLLGLDLEEMLIVTDSSPFNSLLYMTPGFREDFKKTDLCKKLIERNVKLNPLTFLSYPVSSSKDPNRIHSADFSLEIHNSIKDVLKDFLEINTLNPLLGDLQTRSKSVITLTYERIL